MSWQEAWGSGSLPAWCLGTGGSGSLGSLMTHLSGSLLPVVPAGGVHGVLEPIGAETHPGS